MGYSSLEWMVAVWLEPCRLESGRLSTSCSFLRRPTKKSEDDHSALAFVCVLLLLLLGYRVIYIHRFFEINPSYRHNCHYIHLYISE